MAAVAHTAVLFGGYDAVSDLGDTWTWDGVSWTQQDVSGPSPARSSAAMATLNGTVVLFGGLREGSAVIPAAEATLSDTWTWDGAKWTKLDVPGPSARFGAVMVTVGGQ